jgi:hypothetical protein
MTVQIAICSKCGAVLNESPKTSVDDRKPCTSCGSKDRSFEVGMTSAVGVKSTLTAKAYELGSKEPFLEHKSGDSFIQKAAKWVTRVMRIDRRGDRYTEHIYDPKNGETIHHCDEPLSEHRGHGNPKRREI